MPFTKEVIDFSTLSTDDIKKTLTDLDISLTPDEALKIQNKMLRRPPSITELVLFSIQGSEHCSYKSSRPHLKQFTNESPDVILGAKEDAGVVSVATDKEGNRWCIVMSHESHNHPSQIVPYEGAATGVGGNVRDVMCMGAEVIGCTDSFRFGDVDKNKTKWIYDGVVSGVAGYGNPLGIPNLGGDLYFNKGYNDNCLVTIVTLGVVREDHIIHSYAPKKAAGFDLILVGKPTDNSGFGGASFASLELEEEKKEKNKGAVQEPNAFLERHLLKSTYSLFKYFQDNNMIHKVGFKDLGAGGVACASVELAETAGYGANVWMDKIHIGLPNLHPSVYLCSETQERFMWVCPKEVSNTILKHYNESFDLPRVSQGAMASVVGEIRSDRQYIVYDGSEEIVNAPADQVTKGFLYNRKYKPPEQDFFEPTLGKPSDYGALLIDILSHENIASREPIYENYDKQVQGRVHIEAGIADSGVLAPFNSEDYPEEIRKTGIALSTDHNPRYGLLSPYWCGVNAVVESMRNVASIGATPHAVTDCLCFGNPEKPEQMWEFVESARGVADACRKITLKGYPEKPTPIIAGNVSFYNEAKNTSIPASPIISCLGKINDISKSVPMSFQKIDSTIIMIGERKDELGGSLYYSLYGKLGANIPKPDLKEVRDQIFAVTELADKELILCCHDIADGGIAVSIAEMTFNKEIGCSIHLKENLRPEKVFFSETGGFVIEVSANKIAAVRSVLRAFNVKMHIIGKTGGPNIQINTLIDLPVAQAKTNWENGLRDKI